ncbi:lasso peptide isopeptide bond-forming cyclase [Arenicella sp. 4NH20-0111]|uniref:asparagine synthase-related protein n=1 Tax=Arenicella sp. 4NH20-0111 TaxID=3127648 RepID=UPI00310647BA
MSAFFIWLEASGRPIDPVVAKRMFASIAPYGGDTHELLINDNVAIGVAARWMTPEDVGEKQPLYNSSGSQCLLFEGRIDNRTHLLAELGIERAISDGALLHEFLLRFGDSRLPEVVGPFVFVWFDFSLGSVLAARDTMGGRYLVYKQDSQRLMLANTEQAFIDHPDVSHTLNKAKIGAWLIGHQTNSQGACLKGLTVLEPGQSIFWSNPQHQKPLPKSFYHPSPAKRINLFDDESYAREFRRLLDQAVSRRTRAVGQIGVMLSGGLDSVPIAISASKDEQVEKLQAYSWVFDIDSTMDERRYSQPICKAFDIKQNLVHCDQLWTKFDSDTHINPLFPFSLPYAEFQQQTFRQARADGVTILLTGLQGDLLYTHDNSQVVSALLRGDCRLAWKEFRFQLAKRQIGLWSMVKRFLLIHIPVVRDTVEKLRPRRKGSIATDLLQNDIVEVIEVKPHWLSTVARKALRPIQYLVTMDGFAGDDAMLGRVMENKYQIERRYPFRDRDLCEFMLAIPTSQLIKLGVSRPIVKSAYATEFPDDLLNRNDKTQFQSALFRGVKTDRVYEKLFDREPKYWRKYVKQRYFFDKNGQNTFKTLVKWQCAYYNFWYRMWYDAPSDGIGESLGQTPQNKLLKQNVKTK